MDMNWVASEAWSKPLAQLLRLQTGRLGPVAAGSGPFSVAGRAIRWKPLQGIGHEQLIGQKAAGRTGEGLNMEVAVFTPQVV